MEVILMEETQNLGKLGEIVRVKNGYARNYLIPQGKARRATKAAIEDFQKRRAELEKAAAELLAKAESQAEKLNGIRLTTSQKAGVDGRLFGSVTNADIAELVTNYGFPIGKAQVRLPNGPLKIAGEHAVSVALHNKVIVDLTIVVVGEAV